MSFTKEDYWKEYERIMSAQISTLEKKRAVDGLTKSYKDKGVKL